MTFNRRVFWISLITTVISMAYSAFNPFYSLYLIHMGIEASKIKFYREIIKVIWLGVSVGIIYVWFRIGKTADMKYNYKSYLKSMGLSWVIYSIALVPLYFLAEDELWKSIISMGLMNTVMSGYGIGAIMFSALTLGWLAEKRPVFTKEFHQVIVKPVVIYNGVKVAQSILGDYFFHLMYTTPMKTSTHGLYNTIVGVIVFPVRIWYLAKLLSSGRKIDLKTEYPSILFTLWVPRIARIVLTRTSDTLFHYVTHSELPDILNSLYKLTFSVVNSVPGLMGLAFGLICFGYLHSRYNFIEYETRTSP